MSNDKLKDLTDREQFLLKTSKHFCMLPWVHLHSYPDGTAFPCCVSEYKHPVGSLKEKTIQEIMHDAPMQAIRENMLADKPCKECVSCYEQEANGFDSYRITQNSAFGHHIGSVLSGDISLRYYDIRFSNLCNMACRTCWSAFSSKWAKEERKYGWRDSSSPTVTWAGRTRYDAYDQLIPHLDSVEKIYFAGGEPLIMEEHYKLLTDLLRRGRGETVNLFYNTNFSEVFYKGQSIPELWKEFRLVSIGASLDAAGPRAELMRWGTDWDKIVQNREYMLKVCPEVSFYVSSTLSMMNALHITDFHRDWVKQGLVHPDNWNINVLQDPEYYRISVLPSDLKEDVRARYQQQIEWLEQAVGPGRAMNGYRSALSFLDQDWRDRLPEAIEKLETLDRLRGENFWNTFPELAVLRNK